MTDSPTQWHADQDLLARYAGGAAGAVVSGSIEQHLLRCARCRARLAALTDPVQLAAVWAGVEETVQAPRRSLLERLLHRVGLSETDASLLAAAPALRFSWLTGTLLVLLFAAVAVVASDTRGVLVFLVVAPLVPVAGVAVAYGPDADEAYEVALATPYSAMRLVLLRSVAVLAVSLPVAAVGGALLPGPGRTAVTWLLPALAGVSITLAASTWVSVSRAAIGVSVGWLMIVSAAAGPGMRTPLDAIAPAALPVYATLTVVTALVFWARSQHLNLMGRTP